MRIIGLVPVLVLLAATAGCGRDESENVMAPRANALTEAQVDRVLGPEPGSVPVNSADGATNDSVAEPEAIPANSAEEEQP